MNIIIDTYTFNPAARTITFGDYASIAIENVVSVVNITRGVVLYDPSDKGRNGTVATNVLTLEYPTPGMDTADKLMIMYNITTDNRAIVLFDDTFEKDTNPGWNLTAINGATLAITSDANKFMTGGKALVFTSGTTAASEMHRFMYYPPKVIYVGIEFIFASMGENMSNFAFYNSYRNGTNWIRAKILHVNSTNVWSYQDSAGSQQPLLTRDTAESASFARWHRVYVVINISSNKYVKLEIDEQDFSSIVDGQDLRSTADTAVPFMLDFAVETTNTASSSDLIFDRIKATAWG